MFISVENLSPMGISFDSRDMEVYGIIPKTVKEIIPAIRDFLAASLEYDDDGIISGAIHAIDNKEYKMTGKCDEVPYVSVLIKSY